MKVCPTSLPEILELTLDCVSDERGFFARCWSKEIAQEFGLVNELDSWSFSFNHSKATLRGLHWQSDPFGETKLVRCIQGEIWDVAVDMRPNSATYKKWVGTTLSAGKLNALYIPSGFAHGFITLSDNALVHYGINGDYSPEHAMGARWNDPAFAIDWPIEPLIMNERDADCEYR